MKTTFRPSWGNLLPNYLVASKVARPVIAIGLITVATAIALDPGGAREGLVYVAALLLLALGPLSLYVRLSAVDVDTTGLTIRRALGRPTFVPRDRISSILLRSIAHRRLVRSVQDVPNRKVLIVDNDGRCTAALVGWFWTSRDFHEMAGLLEVPCDDEWLPAEASDLRVSVPGSVRWAEVHPTVVALLVAIGAFFLWVLVASIYGS